MSGTRNDAKIADAAAALAQIWETNPAENIGQALTCQEADQMALIMFHVGHPGLGVTLLEDHADGGDCQHHYWIDAADYLQTIAGVS